MTLLQQLISSHGWKSNADRHWQPQHLDSSYFWVRMLFLEYILSPCPTLTLFPIASSPTSPPPLPHPHVVAMLTSNLFLFSLYRWIFYVAPLQRSHNLNMNPTGWISRGAAAIDESQRWSTSTTSAFGFNFLSVFFIVFIYPTIPPLRPISTLPLPLLRSPRATLHAQFSPF